MRHCRGKKITKKENKQFEHGCSHSVTLDIGDTEKKVKDNDEEITAENKKPAQGQQQCHCKGQEDGLLGKRLAKQA